MKKTITNDRQQAIIDARNNLIEIEQKKIKSIFGFTNPGPIISDTSSFATKHSKEIINVKEKKFTHSIFTRIRIFFVVAIFFAPIPSIIQQIILEPASYKNWFFLTLFITLIINFLPQGFSKAAMVITSTGIRLEKRLYIWPDILGTYIIEKQNDRSIDKFQLILTLDNGEIIYYSLGNYGEIYPELSAYIEYFKNQPVNPD